MRRNAKKKHHYNNKIREKKNTNNPNYETPATLTFIQKAASSWCSTWGGGQIRFSKALAKPRVCDRVFVTLALTPEIKKTHIG
jgi:hypothetical protein